MRTEVECSYVRAVLYTRNQKLAAQQKLSQQHLLVSNIIFKIDTIRIYFEPHQPLTEK